MTFIKIPYTELREGQQFKFSKRQRKLRRFQRIVSLKDNAHALKVGDEALIIYDHCDQQPVKAGQEVFLSCHTE